ncbi:MAG: hypothetical protein R3C03_02940 [Pirellulaceae bacterium]
MDLTSIEIQHGVLKDVVGPAVAYNGYTFVPADVDFNGYENGPKLIDAMSNVDPSVRAIVRPGEDAPWASGRIQKLFRQRQLPESERGEKCCMNFVFLAVVVSDNQAVGIPFLCTDNYGESKLYFGDDPPHNSDTMTSIGHAFWSLLLQDANDLVEYVDRMEHVGAGVTIEFGVEYGEPFMRELPN